MLEMGNQSEWGELPPHQTGTVVASIVGERSILMDIEILGNDQSTTIYGRVDLDTTRNLGSLGLNPVIRRIKSDKKSYLEPSMAAIFDAKPLLHSTLHCRQPYHCPVWAIHQCHRQCYIGSDA
jgi:hypothetical protein